MDSHDEEVKLPNSKDEINTVEGLPRDDLGDDSFMSRASLGRRTSFPSGTSELTGDDEDETEKSKTFSLRDVQLDRGELQAESDVMQNIERSFASIGESARDLVMPEISDDRVHDFDYEEEINDQEGKKKGRHRRTGSAPSTHANLADLTAHMFAVRGEGTRHLNKNKDAVTAGEKMAATASLLFADKDSKQPLSSRSTRFSTRPASADEEMGGTTQNQQSPSPHARMEQAQRGFFRRYRRGAQQMQDNKEYFLDFMKPKKQTIYRYFMVRFKFLILPSAVAATFCYYVLNNPPYGRTGDQYLEEKREKASVSWWFWFAGCRLLTMQITAWILELLLIDFLCLKTRILTNLLGPYVSLWIATSKGWPFQATTWGILNVLFLAGNGEFANHWGFWQDWIDMFNAANPSGDVTDSSFYRKVLLLMIGFGAVTGVKRAFLANIMGKRLVVNYGGQLEKLLKDLILMSEVGLLAKRMKGKKQKLGEPSKQFYGIPGSIDSPSKGDATPTGTNAVSPRSGEGRFDVYASRRVEVEQLLGEWEEPEIYDEKSTNDVTVASLLNFRRALSYIDPDYPFNETFGPARSREQCVDSAQKVFGRLTPFGEVLDFDILAPLAEDEEQAIDREKMRYLIRVFRPSREGMLTKIDFVKSVDTVYKNLRTLLASIHSSSQIEEAYENLVNTVFYTVLALIALGVIGVDTSALLVAFGTSLVGIGFIIGPASSRYFEGLLMILVRKPFDIGDRIAVSEVFKDTNPEGSSGWIVEKVNLYTTTMRFAPTREVCTVTNGELARTRIINLNRSKKAVVYIYLKFSVDVSPSNVRQLKSQVGDFVQSKPREWISLNGFRVTRIAADLGYVEYVVVLQHREAWQNVVAILKSKADLQSFCLEVSQELGMRYVAPPLPVDLAITTKNTNDSNKNSDDTGSAARREEAGIDEDGILEIVSRKSSNQRMFEGKKRI